jgi:hypothetical protein
MIDKSGGTNFIWPVQIIEPEKSVQLVKGLTAPARIA